MKTTGRVNGIISNIVIVKADGPVGQNEICHVYVGDTKMMAEVIKVVGDDAYVQVFDSTRGLKIGDKVEFEGHMLEATLAPGMLSKNYDGLQNDLEKMEGLFMDRGSLTDPIDYDSTWEFTPLAKEGDKADYVMMFLIDMAHEGLVVFPTHRMVRNLEKYDVEEILQKLAADFEILPLACPRCMEKEMAKAEDGKRVIGFYAGSKKFYALKLKDENATAPIADHCQAYKDLDVTALHYLILEKHIAIDKANMANQNNLVYTRSFDEAVDKVDSGEFQCSFFLNATKIHQISDVALAGDKMPQKSTYFYPKLTTGLVMRKIID